MKEVVLITDADTELGEALVNVYLNNGYRVFASVAENADKKGLYEVFDASGENLILEVWNRKSPPSAKNLILKVLTEFKVINKVFILGNPVLSNIKFTDIDYMNTELYIDNFIKGNIFLIKEIYKYFKEQSRETDIAALVNVKSSKQYELLDNVIMNGFSGVINALLGDGGVNFCGFETKSEKFEEFAAYIYRLIENKNKRMSGRLLKFTGGIMR
jgi:hypothetical protein